MEKSEAFMKPQNLWIAAESFKVSLAPNPDGLVYYNVPADWFVSCEKNETDDEKTQTQACNHIRLKNVRGVAGSAANYLEIIPDRTTMPANTSLTNYLEALAHLEYDVNPYTITRDSHLIFDGMGHNQQAGVHTELLGDPLPSIVGKAYGPHGLDPINLEFLNDDPPVSVSGQVADQRSWSMRISKDEHPGLKYTDVKKYISCLGNRLFLLAPTGNANFGQEAFKILGPANLMTADPTFLTVPSAHYAAHVPAYPLYTKDNKAINQGATVYCMRPTGHANALQEHHTTVTALDSTWVRDSGNYIYVSVWVQQEMAQANAFPPAANTRFTLLRGNADATKNETWASETISTTIPITVPPTHPGNWDDASNVQLVVDNVFQEKLTRYPGKKNQMDPIPTFTPNHFFSLWNVGFGSYEAPYRFGVHPNGGFTLKIMSDQVLNFTMNNEMRVAMGLNDYMTVPNVYSHTGSHDKEPIPLVRPVDAQTHTWIRDYTKGGSFDHNLVVGQMSDLKVVDAQGVVQGDLQTNTAEETLLRDKGGTGDYFKLSRIITRRTEEYDVIESRIKGVITMQDDGIEPISFANPPLASYIGNESVVSVGGFSTFASIRIVIPDGLIFSPMLSGRSDARILAELRLPSIDPTCNMETGFAPGAQPLGVIMDSNTNYFGDVVWNSSASKQYLPVTSDNPIYRLNVECRLVYRDPTIEPKVLKLGYKDIFEVKLRLLQLQ